MQIAEMIRDVRKRARMSQVDLAERAQTSQPAIARYETGAATPSLGTLERICVACGTTLVVRAIGRRPRRVVRGTRLLDRIRRAKDRLLEAAERHGVRNLRVFGSAARGDETAGSDVDLLVDLEPGRTLLDLIGFQQDAEDILGVGVDAAATDLLKERVRKRALREARPI